MKIKTIIIEDEKMAMRSLERLCSADERLELIASFEDAESAHAHLMEHDVDLILLDVVMPNMSGTELLASLPVTPMVIFTTSNKEYAFDAYEYQAIDFLKKPITPARFKAAIDKAASSQQNNQAAAGPVQQESGGGIYVKVDGRFIRLDPDEVLFFENVGDYVRVKTVDASHIIYGSLKSIDEKLNDSRFLKVHRSFIVNLTKIKDIEDNSIVIEKTVIPVSRAHKQDLMSKLKVL